MTPQEELFEWFLTLSDMISGPVDETYDLEDRIIWFGHLDAETLEQLNQLGQQSSTMRRFLELGDALLERVSEEAN